MLFDSYVIAVFMVGVSGTSTFLGVGVLFLVPVYFRWVVEWLCLLGRVEVDICVPLKFKATRHLPFTTLSAPIAFAFRMVGQL